MKRAIIIKRIEAQVEEYFIAYKDVAERHALAENPAESAHYIVGEIFKDPHVAIVDRSSRVPYTMGDYHLAGYLKEIKED